jgi:hypothetical protein
MPDARFVAREKRRLRLSLDGSSKNLVADVTAQGFSVALFQVRRVGSYVSGELFVDEQPFPFKGEVTWAHLGDPRLCFEGRMGVRFTLLPQELHRLLRS